MSVQILPIATSVLLKDPTASLGDVARAAGIGRTTLHNHFPTRNDLVIAVTDAALDALDEALSEVDLDAETAIADIVAALLPLGPRLEFLLRYPGLETERIADRVAKMDAPLLDLIGRQQTEGLLRKDLPAWWILQTLFAGVFIACEAIAAGRLAPLDAPQLVLTTLSKGLAPCSKS